METIIKEKIQDRSEDIEDSLNNYDIDENGYFTIEPIVSFAKEDYINMRTSFIYEVGGWIITECRKRIGDRMIQRFEPENFTEWKFEITSPPNHPHLSSVWVELDPISEEKVFLRMVGCEGEGYVTPEEAVEKIVSL